MWEQHTWGVGWSVVGAFKGVGTTHLECRVECCTNIHGCENNTCGMSIGVLLALMECPHDTKVSVSITPSGVSSF